MLPDILLDSENYDDILENAKNMIVSIYPEWTDFNYHDPGVTMLEMFAWLKESQQYYLNKIGPENYKKYLKLLGIKRRTKKPSHTYITIGSQDDIVAAKGTKFYAGNICFEADDRTYITSSQIYCCICSTDDGGTRVINTNELMFSGNLRITPFAGEKSREFYIGFDKAFAANEWHNIYFSIRSDDGMKRNPITDPESFIPLVDITAEYYDGVSWKELECRDDTFGFLSSGVLSFKSETEPKDTTVGQVEAYFIRFTLKDGEYDTLPVINDLEFSVLPVTQRDTRAEYYDFDIAADGKYKLFTQLSAAGDSRIFLKGSDGLFTPVMTFAKEIDPETGETTFTVLADPDAKSVRIVNMMNDFYLDSAVGQGTGLPFQEYDLESKLLEYESFTIMTELPDSGGKYAEWKKTDDFSLAKAEDFVYILDSNEGRIKFGDCIRGMAPEGRIFIIGCSMTLSSEGNVTRGKINRMGDSETQELEISNFSGSKGGTAEESLEECCVRAHKLLETTDTIVTNEDCERFISSIQGLKIEKCQVINPIKNNDRSSGMVTSVVVKPYSADGKGVPNERYIKNIMKAVESHRLLGTQLRIVRPEYTAVSVYADITVLKDHSDANSTVENTIRDFFGTLKDDFGAKIVYSRLYELLDTLECVVSVNTLTLETNGSGSQRTREGNIRLFPNVSAYLADVETMLTAVY